MYVVSDKVSDYIQNAENILKTGKQQIVAKQIFNHFAI